MMCVCVPSSRFTFDDCRSLPYRPWFPIHTEVEAAEETVSKSDWSRTFLPFHCFSFVVTSLVKRHV